MSAFDESGVCRSILDSLPTGLCAIDTQKKIVFWSVGAERITGHARHEVVGHSCVPEPLIHCDQPGCEFCGEDCPLALAMKNSHPADGSGFLHHKDGHEIPVRIRAVPIHNDHGSIIGAVEVFEELQPGASQARTDLLRQFPEFVDGISGVANRTMMHLHLRHALSAMTEMHVPFAILFFRIEGLPRFRASLGTEAGSSLLRVVARTLESALWISDFVGRWSDDEFLAILGGCAEDSLATIRERIRHTLAGQSIEWWGERRSLPVSIGEAVARADDTIDSVLERARTSLDAASAWRMGSSEMDSSVSGS